MRHKRNPYEGLREHDIEHRELLARLRAAADTLKSFNVLDPRDPKFQALLPEAALNWPNRELRQAVEKAESDVKFYADFFQKRNPRKRSKMSYRKKNPLDSERWKVGSRTYVVERSTGGWRARWFGSDNENHWFARDGGELPQVNMGAHWSRGLFPSKAEALTAANAPGYVSQGDRDPMGTLYQRNPRRRKF